MKYMLLSSFRKEQRTPSRAHPDDAGIDLTSSVARYIAPGAIELFPTGIALEISHGYVGWVCPRSGLALAGVTVMNAPGVIDSGYRGEVEVILINLGEDPYPIHVGDRIAQLVIAPIAVGALRHVDALTESLRGEDGFGSTGA